jgi:hypothetical protein
MLTPEDMKARVDLLREKAAGPDGDCEEDHGEEDDIYKTALAWIAGRLTDDPVGVAKAAGLAEDIEFDRWYA